MPTTTLIPYTLDDLIANFGRPTVEKAKAYLNGAILQLHMDGNHLSGIVQGTASTPYHVDIDVEQTTLSPRPYIESFCTCPVGMDCKHAVAIMLAALRYRTTNPEVNPQVLAWSERVKAELASANKPAKEGLIYMLTPPSQPATPPRIQIYKVRLNIDGTPHIHSAQPWFNIDGALRKQPSFVRNEDMPILRLLGSDSQLYARDDNELKTHADILALEHMLASGRLYVKGREMPLTRGEDRPAHLTWEPQGQCMTPKLVIDPPAQLLSLPSLHYVDTVSGELGRLNTTEDPRLLRHLLALPPLLAPDLSIVGHLLSELAPRLAPPGQPGVERIDSPPVPVLRLQTLPVRHVHRYRGYTGPCDGLDVAELAFRYRDVLIAPRETATLHKNPQGQWVEIIRHMDAEARWTRQLKKYGLTRLHSHAVYLNLAERQLYGLENEAAWAEFMTQQVPKLREAGWHVEIPDDFRHLWLEPEGWDVSLHEEAPGWLDLDMGIIVEGNRLPLTPMLADLFERDARWLNAQFIGQQADDAPVFLNTPEGRRVRVEAGRVKTIVRQLIDLFDDASRQESLRLPLLDAARLEALPDDMSLRGTVETLEIARRIRELGQPKPVEPPAGLGLELRPYQREGLNWLCHLRELGLGGILADDMGLGKTAQTLAYLLREKQQGRLTLPALVVLPTSLLFNWRHEAERIAPNLRVLPLHGARRHEDFAHIAEHDLVLTTYPLLWRDIEQLEKQRWGELILDEAQTVKNDASQTAQAIRRLQAEHRLCLTGTPMENHLGELWALFDFLLPGFLGEKSAFTQAFRSPIEKQGDTLRRDLLARRLRPFMLRRRKEDVAAELPPKTVVVRTVELEGGQRDLYETVRAAMDSKVREAIANQGLARSHIVILDALLKLRQVCCDPRLLPTRQGSGKRKLPSAKLELLLDMLRELVDEGRRILLFSQFTTMLDLISQALNKAELPHVILTGQTRDREAVVRQFQQGDIPIFLISLKAGGVGLNLTAADTVIHYDPWWNPAAEDQATDRAHRIGQTRNVFVYKLVAKGSIEEKILALQERKAELAAGILGEDASAMGKFSEEDLKALLAPLPE